MKGLQFGNKHSYDDWKLILTDKTIGLPNPKTSSVDVEGADGSIDTSEVFGEIKFENRKLEFEFTMTANYENFDELLTEIANHLHGKKLKIIRDEDDSYYFIGRCSINQWTTDKRVGKIVISCDCEPYKYELKQSVVTATINGLTYVKLFGKRKTVTPTIEVSDYMYLLSDDREVLLTPNKPNVVLDLFIYEGANTLAFNGNGQVKISYTGGEL